MTPINGIGILDRPPKKMIVRSDNGDRIQYNCMRSHSPRQMACVLLVKARNRDSFFVIKLSETQIG